MNIENIEITKDCIQKVSNIGNDIVHNICNGESYIIPWGSADWIFNIAILSLFAITTITLLAMVVVVIIGAINLFIEKWRQNKWNQEK